MWVNVTGISNKVAWWRDGGVKIVGSYVAELMWLGINVVWLMWLEMIMMMMMMMIIIIIIIMNT